MATAKLSVVVCTYNPRADLISRALRALSVQDLRPSDYELIIVDNNSSPPVARPRLERLAGRDVNLIVERRQGLTFARVAGVRAAKADLLCFVDDDNELDESYLANVLKIAAEHPGLGVFGGVAIGAPEIDNALTWAAAAPFLGVRDIGGAVQFSDGETWRECEPIGAGLCVRRAVADAYADFVDAVEDVGGLGRRGGALLSGEDSLFSRIGHHLHLTCGYFPDLRLKHHIAAARLRFRYVARLMEGHGRSYVLLERISGRPVAPVSGRAERVMIARNFLHRVSAKGLSHALLHMPWDVGFARQSREAHDRAPGGALNEFLRARGV